MDTSRRVRCSASQPLAVVLAAFLGAPFAVRADAPPVASADADEPKSLPQDGNSAGAKRKTHRKKKILGVTVGHKTVTHKTVRERSVSSNGDTSTKVEHQ